VVLDNNVFPNRNSILFYEQRTGKNKDKMKVLEDVKRNIEESNRILLDLSKLIKRLSRIIMMVNVVNVLTIIVLILLFVYK
jgi:hypothetical protein